MTKPLVMQTLLPPFRLCQIVDLAVRNGCSKVSNVCLVTLALLEPIVTQNMCFYGPMFDLAHVLYLAVAKRPRMNCVDDLFVPTDMVSVFHPSFHLYSPCLIVNPIAVYGSSKCVLSRTDC